MVQRYGMAINRILEIDASRGVEQEALSAPERRRITLRNRIFTEAARLFEENGGEHGGGIERTTAEEIASRSDISVRTFFRYFKSKLDAIYVDVPTAMESHLALTHIWLGRLKPVEASLTASIIHLRNSTGDEIKADQLHRAMSSSVFLERRSALRAEWRQALADLIAPRLGGDVDAALRALVISVTTLDIRDVAMDYWNRRGGNTPVIDCFNKALEVSHGLLGSDFPEKVRFVSAA